MGKYLLAHDLGTSGNKATLFSIEGQLIASCTYNYDVYYISNEDMCASKYLPIGMLLIIYYCMLL